MRKFLVFIILCGALGFIIYRWYEENPEKNELVGKNSEPDLGTPTEADAALASALSGEWQADTTINGLALRMTARVDNVSGNRGDVALKFTASGTTVYESQRCEVNASMSGSGPFRIFGNKMYVNPDSMDITTNRMEISFPDSPRDDSSTRLKEIAACHIVTSMIKDKLQSAPDEPLLQNISMGASSFTAEKDLMPLRFKR